MMLRYVVGFRTGQGGAVARALAETQATTHSCSPVWHIFLDSDSLNIVPVLE